MPRAWPTFRRSRSTGRVGCGSPPPPSRTTGTDAVYLVAVGRSLADRGSSPTSTPRSGCSGSATSCTSRRTSVSSPTPGFDGSTFASERTVLTFPAGVGELNGTGPVAGRADRARRLVADQCDGTDARAYSAAVVSFLPDGSDLQRRGLRHPRPDRPRVCPGHRRPPRHDEPARRSRRRHARRLAWRSSSRARIGASPTATARADAPARMRPAPIAVLDTHAAVSGLAIVTGRARRDGRDVGARRRVVDRQTSSRVALARRTVMRRPIWRP